MWLSSLLGRKVLEEEEEDRGRVGPLDAQRAGGKQGCRWPPLLQVVWRNNRKTSDPFDHPAFSSGCCCCCSCLFVCLFVTPPSTVSFLTMRKRWRYLFSSLAVMFCRDSNTTSVWNTTKKKSVRITQNNENIFASAVMWRQKMYIYLYWRCVCNKRRQDSRRMRRSSVWRPLEFLIWLLYLGCSISTKVHWQVSSEFVTM